jgi:multicomponent Na+:H+ antiporter subunit A
VTTAVLTIFLLALAAPFFDRLLGRAGGWVLALVPAGLTAWFALRVPAVAAGETFREGWRWMPTLGVEFSFYLDGLSLVFALLVLGIGALIVVYAGGYLSHHPLRGRFQLFLLLFMGSMLGVVLADDAITLFIFWELTSFTSYLLIGFDHERERARWAALQALLVTGVGGLALLAGMVLLGQAGGTMSISALLARGEAVRADALYLPILLLILAGAFTKSAQFPFHFWLPNAMEAPTPVSAYLHSATMVKAGVYLLARLQPVLGGTELWWWTVVLGGGVTMLVGAWLAWQKTDLKQILAYSTVSALGILVLLLGVGTEAALAAMALFLVGHALYKGALFLVAGAVDHGTGLRDVERLGGLRRAMPITAAAAGVAALSMAGLPPLAGFLAKESFYESLLAAPRAGTWLFAAAMAASVLLVAVAAIVSLGPFFGEKREMLKKPHEAPPSLWLGPVVLGIAGLLAGLLPGAFGSWFIAPAASAAAGWRVDLSLALWHGLNPVLGLSAATLAAGFGFYAFRGRLRRAFAGLDAVTAATGPARGYEVTLDGMLSLAKWQTRFLQSGYLRYYLLMVIVSVVGLAAYTLAARHGMPPLALPRDVRFYEVALGVLILLAALMAVRTRSRLAAVAALGVVGYGVALVYILFGAPDLAMTQFLIETLMVLLFVLVLYHLPRFQILSTEPERWRDLFVAGAAGALMTVLVLVATAELRNPHLSEFFAGAAKPEAHGRNIVNVILVDFRGLDTLGEITVLAVAGVGVYALLKLRWPKGEEK